METKQAILITGASRGLGRHTLEYLHGKGERVIGVVRGEALDCEFSCVQADLLSEDAVEKIVGYLNRWGIRLKGWVHNAGVLHRMEINEYSREKAEMMWELHVRFPMELMTGLVEYLEKGSHVVQISSMSGYSGASRFPGLAAYGASKAAQASLAESWATELSRFEISSNALALGSVQTDMLREAFPGFTGGVPVEKMGAFVGEFVLNGHTFFNGKVLPVAMNTP